MQTFFWGQNLNIEQFLKMRTTFDSRDVCISWQIVAWGGVLRKKIDRFLMVSYLRAFHRINVGKEGMFFYKQQLFLKKVYLQNMLRLRKIVHLTGT